MSKKKIKGMKNIIKAWETYDKFHFIFKTKVGCLKKESIREVAYDKDLLTTNEFMYFSDLLDAWIEK